MQIIENKIETIKEVFHEQREICPTPLPQIEKGDGTTFKTTNGEIIYLELQLKDFTVEELVRYTSIMEDLYEEHEKHCTAYILCDEGVEVKVNEMPIKSKADFTIKLAQTDLDSCKVVLNGIKNKIQQGELLDEADIYALQMIPVMCSKDERDYYRTQVFKIMNEIGL